MKYLLMIVEPPRDWPRDQLAAALERHGEFVAALRENGSFLETGRLAPARSARTARLDAQMRRGVTDGPFTESKEALAGYYLIEAASRDEAVSWAERLPLSIPGSSVEVREVLADPYQSEGSA
jgi:hypothetical protein